MAVKRFIPSLSLARYTYSTLGLGPTGDVQVAFDVAEQDKCIAVGSALLHIYEDYSWFANSANFSLDDYNTAVVHGIVFG